MIVTRDRFAAVCATDNAGKFTVMYNSKNATFAGLEDIDSMVDFLYEAIKNGLNLGKGHGPCDPLGLAQ